MQISAYLIISKGLKKWNPQMKLSKKLTGSMPSSSVAVRLCIELPDTIFEKPQLQASIKINEADIQKPIINAEVLDNIKAEFQKNLGIEMSINVVEQKKK